MSRHCLAPVATWVAFCIAFAANSNSIESKDESSDGVCALQSVPRIDSTTFDMMMIQAKRLEVASQYVTTDSVPSDADAVIQQALVDDQAGYEVHTSKYGRAWATMSSNLGLSEQPLTSQESSGHTCGSRGPLHKTPKVCLFLFTALQDEAYSKRTLAVAQTWAASARNFSQAAPNSFSMHFFVDPKFRHLVESVLPSSEIIEREQAYDNVSGTMYFTRLQALNSALQQSTSCDWVVVPEDDVYMNVPLVTSKLACLDSAGPPRLMGTVLTYGVPRFSRNYNETFIQGSTWIMNAAAVPVLLQVAQKHDLAQHDRWGDVAVAECLREEYMEKREEAFPFQEFGCRINDISGQTGKIQGEPEPECIDWFHKVFPENMAELHESVSRRPCQRSSADLMEHCVTKFAPSGVSSLQYREDSNASQNRQSTLGDTAANDVRSVRMVVEGNVQGVYFRETTKIKATALNLKGKVWNRNDGKVQILAEGETKNVDALVAWVRQQDFQQWPEGSKDVADMFAADEHASHKIDRALKRKVTKVDIDPPGDDQPAEDGRYYVFPKTDSS